MRRPSPIACLAGLALMAAGSSAVAAGSAEDCTGGFTRLASPRVHQVEVGRGKAVLRDRFGGQFHRSRLQFTWTVKLVGVKPDQIEQVDFLLDGKLQRSSPGPRLRREAGDRFPDRPFYWTAGTSRFKPGRHRVEILVTPEAGDPATIAFNVTASDCGPPSFLGDATSRRASFVFQSAFETLGPDLHAVSVNRPKGLKLAPVAELRGRRLGTLEVFADHSRSLVKASLRVSARASGSRTQLYERDGLTVFLSGSGSRLLDIVGLPKHTQCVKVELGPTAPFKSNAFNFRAKLMARDGDTVSIPGSYPAPGC